MATKKSATKKSASGKGASKKSSSKKAAAPKKTAAKKSTSKKSAPAKKSAPKKSASRAPQMADDRSLLEKLFVDSLKDIYWAEKALVKALPKMQKAATAPELQDAIAEHLVVTEEQAGRVEEVFEMLGEKAQAKKCEAMAGLIEEANSIISETPKGTATRDVGIIMAAQKVEHYEIATYGSLVSLARTLGNEDVANLLQITLDEEKETDELLTQIAEANINLEAAEEDEDDEDEESDEEEGEDD
jgi:ferritin-like metal-binding protein YciE